MGSCHVLGYSETVGPSLPDSLWVSWSGSLRVVRFLTGHTPYSPWKRRRGRKRRKGRGEAAAQSYFNYTTYFERLESEPWTDKKHGLMKRKVFLSEALCSPDQQALKSFLKPLGSLQGQD